MKDLTEIFIKGIENSGLYNKYNIIRKANKLEGIFCDFQDEGYNTWILLWHNTPDNKFIIYAYISEDYPVALTEKACPEEIKKFLEDNNIFITELEPALSCDQSILKKYARHTKFLDDRFLDECDFSPDDKRLYYILEGIKYVTPYNFTFDEIR